MDTNKGDQFRGNGTAGLMIRSEIEIYQVWDDKERKRFIIGLKTYTFVFIQGVPE